MTTIKSDVEVLTVEATGLYGLQMCRTRHTLNVFDLEALKPFVEERFEIWDASASRVIFVGKSRDEAYAFWFALIKDLLEAQIKQYENGGGSGPEGVNYSDLPLGMDAQLPGGISSNVEYRRARIVFLNNGAELTHREVSTGYIHGLPEVSATSTADLMALTSVLLAGAPIEKYTIPKGGSIWTI